jgi:hypothetical protein
MREQGRTSHEMSTAVGNVSKEALRVTNTNRNHLDSADRVRSAVTELRQITSRNADGVKETLTSTSGLAIRARELGEIMDSIVGDQAANGNQTGKTKATKTSNSRRRRASTENNSGNDSVE